MKFILYITIHKAELMIIKMWAIPSILGLTTNVIYYIWYDNSISYP